MTYSLEVVGLAGRLFAVVGGGKYGAGVHKADRAIKPDLDGIDIARKKMRGRDKTV